MPVFSPYAALLATVPVAESALTVLGSETHYWTYGPDDAAVTVLVVHGYRGDHHGLEPMVAQFTGIRFVMPDLPGFGASTPLEGRKHDVDGYATWLAAFTEALGLHDAILLGHSFGSIVSSAAVASGLVTPPKLVLINPIAASALQGPSGILTRGAIGYYRLALALPERVGFWMLGNWALVQGISVTMAESKDPVIRRFVHDQHHTYFSRYASRQTVVEGFDASVSHDVSEFADGITMPTLLVGAIKDPITSPKQVEQLHQRIPGSQLRMIADVGHLVHYETPRAAAEAILPFLGGGALAKLP